MVPKSQPKRSSLRCAPPDQEYHQGMRMLTLVALHGPPCSATRENLTKTLVKNENPKFSYRNNENDNLHHGGSSNKHVELVYTKYEVNRSIIKGGGRIQPFRAQNPVFDTLTPAVGQRRILK